MSDQYFKDKAESILRVIHYRILNPSLTEDEYDAAVTLLGFNLKEVARDQRYACVDAIHSECRKEYSIGHFINGKDIGSIIQNANIEIKK